MDNFYTQSFQDFAAGVKPLDLALYAGAGLILWVLFQDKLGGLKTFVSDLFNKVSSKLPESVGSVLPSVPTESNKDVFFQLVTSWKQTRDLAVKNGCAEAVKVADQMFPLLGPNVCQSNKTEPSQK